MGSPCVNAFIHSQVDWPRDENGLYWCPFDSPITYPPVWQPIPPGEPNQDLPVEPPVLPDNELPPMAVPYEPVGAPSYWDYGDPDDIFILLLHDTERIAQRYTIYGAVLPAREYTEAENARADAIVNANTVLEAQAALARAVQVNSAPEELQALQVATLAGEGIEDGDPWQQPTGAHDAYPIDAVVTHDGGTWQSTVPANVWQPGVSGWRPVGAGIPPWVQPTGAHDAYNQGDIVTHNDLVWQSNIDANVWEPPEQWTEMDPGSVPANPIPEPEPEEEV